MTVGQTRYPSGRLGNKILWDGLYDMNAIYGFRTALNSTSYVETGVTYIEANANFQAGSVTNPSSSLAIATADMGDWKNTWIYHRFRPCMLKTNGKVDYFLDPDDISKKMDGTASDIENTSYDGNAMVQIGQIWVQISCTNPNATTNKYLLYDVRFSSKQRTGYTCFTHLNDKGVMQEYIYHAIYEASWKDTAKTKIQSKNKQQLINSTTSTAGNSTIQQIFTGATNVGAGYSAEKRSILQLFELLLLLFFKGPDVTQKLGNGCYRGGNSNPVASYASGMWAGARSDAGMFAGYIRTPTTVPSSVGMIAFYIQNLYGNGTICTLGSIAKCVSSSYTQRKIEFYNKMTYTTADGSTVTGYNHNADNYLQYFSSTLTVSSSATDTSVYVSVCVNYQACTGFVVPGQSSSANYFFMTTLRYTWGSSLVEPLGYRGANRTGIKTESMILEWGGGLNLTNANPYRGDPVASSPLNWAFRYPITGSPPNGTTFLVYVPV